MRLQGGIDPTLSNKVTGGLLDYCLVMPFRQGNRFGLPGYAVLPGDLFALSGYAILPGNMVRLSGNALLPGESGWTVFYRYFCSSCVM
jgi:hypothetical protein